MRKTARQLLSASLLCLLLASSGWTASGPTEKVRLTVDLVIGILKTPDLESSARREKLSATIRGAFDFPSMSQRILAQNWKKATPQEQEQFILLFSQLLEQSYVGNIENYTDEKVEFVSERIKQGSAAIDTLILTKSKEIPVSYRLQQSGDEWKVYDVVIESVSFVSNYRSSYGEIIRKEGMSGLLAKMQEKISELQQAGKGQ